MSGAPKPVLDRCDCLVVGAGPAGAALAAQLARDGLQVVLCDHRRPRRAVPEETLLPAALPALARLRALPSVAAGAVGDALRHGSIWGSDELVLQPPREQGWRLVRRLVDAALQGAAVEAGAQFWNGSSVVGGLPAAGHGDVLLRHADGVARTLQAATVVVATGRSVPQSLAPTRVLEQGPPTAAFCWRGHGSQADLGVAVVEATAAGWSWWLPQSDGTVGLAVFVDLAAVRQLGHRQAVAAVLQASRGPAARLGQPAPVSAVRATPLLRSGGPVLLCGDAAACVDPLSSQGVEKALASADQAACAVRTLLVAPELRPLVLAEHRRWEAQLFAAHRRTAASFYAKETRFAAEPFWAARAQPAPPRPRPGPGQPLQAHPELRPAGALRRVGPRYVVEPGLGLPGQVLGRSRVGYVPVAPLLAAFGQPRVLEAGVQAAAADPRLYVLAPAAVRLAAQELFAAGFLVSVGAAAPP